MRRLLIIISSLFMIDPVGPMVQQKIDKRVTSCTHATQKRQSLLDNTISQRSRVWVWRIVDKCLPASQITCRLGVPSAIASRLGSQRVLSTQHEQTQSERHSAASMHIYRGLQLAGSLPVTYLSDPECRTMTSTDAHTVRVALALHNTATVAIRSYLPTVCRGCVTCGSSRAAQANICAGDVSRTSRLSLHRMLGIPHCRPSSPKLLATGRFVF